MKRMLLKILQILLFLELWCVNIFSFGFIEAFDLKGILRRIPLKVRAISAKINYLKSTHSTSTFGTLSKTTHCSSFL